MMSLLGSRCRRPLTLRPALTATPSSLTVTWLRSSTTDWLDSGSRPSSLFQPLASKSLVLSLWMSRSRTSTLRELSGCTIQNGVLRIVTSSINTFVEWLGWMNEGRNVDGSGVTSRGGSTSRTRSPSTTGMVAGRCPSSLKIRRGTGTSWKFIALRMPLLP